MSYYDHATAIFLRLDRWGEPDRKKQYELEAIAAEHRQSTPRVRFSFMTFFRKRSNNGHVLDQRNP